MVFFCDIGRWKLGVFLVVLVVVEIFFICLMVCYEYKLVIMYVFLR